MKTMSPSLPSSRTTSSVLVNLIIVHSNSSPAQHSTINSSPSSFQLPPAAEGLSCNQELKICSPSSIAKLISSSKHGPDSQDQLPVSKSIGLIPDAGNMADDKTPRFNIRKKDRLFMVFEY